MLIIGIGGSGRQSLSKLASFICMYSVFQIEVSKNYKRSEFREDIKRLYSQCGISNKETTFIFVDTQVVDEAFLEDINNVLSSGEVPNLYKNEELEEVCLFFKLVKLSKLGALSSHLSIYSLSIRSRARSQKRPKRTASRRTRRPSTTSCSTVSRPTCTSSCA